MTTSSGLRIAREKPSDTGNILSVETIGLFNSCMLAVLEAMAEGQGDFGIVRLRVPMIRKIMRNSEVGDVVKGSPSVRGGGDKTITLHEENKTQSPYQPLSPSFLHFYWIRDLNLLEIGTKVHL